MIILQTKKYTVTKNTLNYKVILIIILVAILIQIYNWLLPLTPGEIDIIELSFMGISGIVAIAAFHTAKQYWDSNVFGKSYLALGLGYSCIFIGEIIWNYQTIVLSIEPYPSIADFFYFGLYPFVLYHMITNFKFFNQKFKFQHKLWLILFPIVIIVLFFYISMPDFDIEKILANEEGVGFDFVYTLIFISGAASTTTFAIFGRQVFRKNVLASAWTLIIVGIILNDFTDLIYVHTQMFGDGYERSDPLIAMWILSGMLIVYALYKHQKIL